MAARHATEGEEEYLQTLFWLYEAGLPMTAANLARAMQLSAPTVHEMVGRLERDEREGLGDAPWPPHFRKQRGEPRRVQPSRRRA